MIISLGFIVIFPVILKILGLSSIAAILTGILRWPLLAIFVIIGLGLLYRFAPDRGKAKFRWVNWGAVIAAILWLIVSMLFSFYVSHSDSYNRTYGSIGAIIILLMWFHISAFVVLLGAKLNAEMELRTGKESQPGEKV